MQVTGRVKRCCCCCCCCWRWWYFFLSFGGVATVTRCRRRHLLALSLLLVSFLFSRFHNPGVSKTWSAVALSFETRERIDSTWSTRESENIAAKTATTTYAQRRCQRQTQKTKKTLYTVSPIPFLFSPISLFLLFLFCYFNASKKVKEFRNSKKRQHRPAACQWRSQAEKTKKRSFSTFPLFRFSLPNSSRFLLLP